MSGCTPNLRTSGRDIFQIRRLRRSVTVRNARPEQICTRVFYYTRPDFVPSIKPEIQFERSDMFLVRISWAQQCSAFNCTSSRRHVNWKDVSKDSIVLLGALWKVYRAIDQGSDDCSERSERSRGDRGRFERM